VRASVSLFKMVPFLVACWLILPVQAAELEAELFAAAREGKLAEVKQLILDGTQVDAVNPQGRTPLMGAAFFGNHQVVELLLAEGANVAVTDKQGMTALMLAAQSGNPELILLLLANGAEAATATASGMTALSVAELRGNDAVIEVLSSLKSEGQDEGAGAGAEKKAPEGEKKE